MDPPHSLKNETAQRALVRPLGALALMRMLGFEVGADEATLAIALARPDMGAEVRRIALDLLK